MVQHRATVQDSSTLTQRRTEGLVRHASVAPTVLGWHAGPDALPTVLDELWRCAAQLGWLSPAVPRIVMQIGQRWRSTLVLETAMSLAQCLVQRWPHATIEIFDPAACGSEWAPFAVWDVLADTPVCLADTTAPEGLRVPARWFESYFLVTVAATGPLRVGRFVGLLDAQADPLRHLGNTHLPEALSYAAHRLARSDLAVACGYTHREDPTSERWWAVSPSDVAVDQGVARAARMAPETLSHLHFLAHHEVLAPYPEMLGNLPPLHEYAPSVWQARLSLWRLKASMPWHTVVRDVRMTRRNLHRIPHFIRRRVARVLRKRGRV